MPLRPCLGTPGKMCRRLTSNPGSRCDGCQSAQYRAVEQRRGNRHRRGYDNAHYAMRDRLLPAAYGKPCPRCGEPMLRGQALDLGHSVDLRVDPSSRADRIEHASCNRGARWPCDEPSLHRDDE